MLLLNLQQRSRGSNLQCPIRFCDISVHQANTIIKVNREKTLESAKKEQKLHQHQTSHQQNGRVP